jgi:hypothetical protein
MKKDYNELSIPGKIEFSTVELNKWEEFEITGNKIITVISWKIEERVKWTLKTLESSVYHSWNIIAEKDTVLSVFDIKDLNIILDKISVNDNFWKYCRENWSQLRDLWDVEWFEKVDLYRWNQIDLNIKWEKFKLNLWFCWPEVDCLFHNEHNFIEIHTDIAGRWFMQKSLTAKNDWNDKLVETVGLMPWSSHRTFNIEWEVEENWNPKYPFHRWLGWETGNIWLVIEKYV